MKIAHNWDHKIITKFLFDCFEKEKDDLLLRAAADCTQRWELIFFLDHENLGDNNFGGSIAYDKKKRKFTYLQYSDKHNFAVRVSIETKIYWSAWEHRDWLYKNVPQYYCYSNKKLTEWLLTH